MSVQNIALYERMADTFREILIDNLGDNGLDPLVRRLSMEIPSTTAKNDYWWLRDYTTMRRWVGPRKSGDAVLDTYEVKNETYEATVAIPRELLEDDNGAGLAIYENRIRQFPGAYNRKLNSTFFTLLNAADSTVGIDGQYLIDTDHPTYDDAAGTQSNDPGVVSLTGPNYDTQVKAMNALTDHNGEILGVNPNLLVVGPALRTTARDLFGPALTGGGNTNVYQGEIEWTWSPRITGNKWFLIDTSDAMLMPFIFQNRLGLTAEDPLTSGVLPFRDNKYEWGVRARWAFAAGVWQNIRMMQ